LSDDFVTATDDLMAAGVRLEEIADALGVAHQTVRGYRLAPNASGYRRPPEGWQERLIRFAEERGKKFQLLRRDLAMQVGAKTERNVDWFCALVRIAGASFAGSASLVQLQNEIDMAAVKRRLQSLEDPISQIHPDVPRLAERLYEAVRSGNVGLLEIPDEFYDEFARPLAALHSSGYLREGHALARRRPINIRMSDPTFLLYCATLSDDSPRVATVVEAVDSAETGRWLKGAELAQQYGVPLPVVDAVFEVYEVKGYGLTSKTIGASLYYPKV